MGLFQVLLGTVVLLAALHMVAPDHWLPIMTVSSIRRFTNRKKYVISAFLGALHAVTSIVVAVSALLIGVILVKNYLSYLYDGGIILLILIGLYFIINGHFERVEASEMRGTTMNTVLGVSILPDLALLPIMITGFSLGISKLGFILVIFLVVSGLSLPIVVLAASEGLSKFLEKVPPKYIDYVMGIILILTAVVLKFL